MMRRVLKVVTWVAVLLMGMLALLTGWFLTLPTLPSDVYDVLGSPSVDGLYAASADSAQAWAQAVARDLGLPSVSLAVGVDGEVVWALAFGLADIDDGIGASVNTPYRIGSVSKAVTSVGLGRLVQDGRIDLDAHVRTYVPTFPEKRWPVPVRLLAGHMGGVRHYTSGFGRTFLKETFNRERYDSVIDALEIFEDDPLLYEPGTGFQYSTHGYTLLSAVLESAAGQAYLAFMDQAVFAPLGMERTGPDDGTATDPLPAVPLHMDKLIVPLLVQLGIPAKLLGTRYVRPPDADPSYKWAGAGLLSTASDLVRMANALMSYEFLDSATVELLWAPQRLRDGYMNPQRYGMGWRIDREAELLGLADSVRVIHHGGSSPGGSAFLLLVPEADVAVAVLTNVNHLSQPGPMRLAAYRIAGEFVRAREQIE
ncbi:MAG: beta-lactamase family protein [Gemmatimonadales bacterium]|nr:beta-lactamase family protein [Gemmatimonadales bacterium]